MDSVSSHGKPVPLWLLHSSLYTSRSRLRPHVGKSPKDPKDPKEPKEPPFGDVDDDSCDLPTSTRSHVHRTSTRNRRGSSHHGGRWTQQFLLEMVVAVQTVLREGGRIVRFRFIHPIIHSIVLQLLSVTRPNNTHLAFHQVFEQLAQVRVIRWFVEMECATVL